MIPAVHNLLPTMVQHLHQSKFEFFPTGSRFFGGMTSEKSDWDFFARDSEEIREFLASYGFENQSSDYEADKTLETVYSATRWSHGVAHKIDVQLVKPEAFHRKQCVQTFLKTRYGDNGLPGDKNMRSELWSILYDIIAVHEL